MRQMANLTTEPKIRGASEENQMCHLAHLTTEPKTRGVDGRPPAGNEKQEKTEKRRSSSLAASCIHEITIAVAWIANARPT